MVYQLGMGSETGLLIHDGEPGSLSPEAHAQMDREVRAILARLYQRTIALLSANREPLAALVVALLDRETLDGAEAVEIMEEAGLARIGGFSAPRVPSAAAVAMAASA